MARTPLQINFDTAEDSIFPICRAAGVEGKEANEVYHSWDALRLWRDLFESRLGALSECIHHSNPDDPPDLTFAFDHGHLEVEHTRLEPSHFGWAHALHHRKCPDQCITLPSISQQPKNQGDLLSVMLTLGGDWSDVESEMNDWFRFLINLIRKKIEHRSGGVLVIQDVSLNFESQLRPLAEAVHTLLSPRRGLIQDWKILLHSRSNSIQYLSYLITAGEGLRSRSNNGIGEESIEQDAPSNGG